MLHHFKYLLIIILLSCVACNKSTTLSVDDVSEQEIVSFCDTIKKTPNFNEYFEQKPIASDKYYNYIYDINEKLKWKNNIDTTVGLEIRLYIFVNWKPIEIYRLQYKEGLGWKGDLTTILFDRIEKRSEPFTPFMGWENFEKALLLSDVKNIDATKIVYPGYGPHSLNPSYVTVQLLLPTSSKIISLETYFSFSLDCPDLEGVAEMDTLMYSLLDSTIYREKYYP